MNHFFATHKDAIEAFVSLATLVFAVIGGVWALVLFGLRRARYPRLNVKHRIHHWAAGGKTLLHVSVETQSVGEVVLQLDSVLVRVQQLVPVPPDVLRVIADDKDPVREGESEVNWPLVDSRHCDWKDEPREIEPGESEEHHFDFVIPVELERIEVYSYISNAKKSAKTIGWNTTTIHCLRDVEERMPKESQRVDLRTNQGPQKPAPPPPPPPPPPSGDSN